MNKIQKIEKFNKENNKLTYKKIESQLDLLLKGQEVNGLAKLARFESRIKSAGIRIKCHQKRTRRRREKWAKRKL